ncbi:hypothetical protein [Erythrobacter sp. F6033]|uniref:hypothetical protein n=1 Tax=Erythrobacter sp. F6033 TaxID=2926401 RepID=UPI001FF3357F|nr:hypothetical protein [Erythrobacter sp. F6033]MCK0128821.1 hypothetical protein [Erythrobacter sp. F6033]
MNNTPKPAWHLALIIIWYGVLLLGSGGLALLGLAFGSEAYRNKPIPFIELAIIVGPFLVSAALLAATLYCWNTGRQRAAYQLCGVSVLVIVAVFAFLTGGLGI